MSVLQKSDRPAARPARGVLHRTGEAPVLHERTAPCAELRDVVEHFWAVAWDLRGREPLEAQTLPHPSVHLLVEGARHEVSGVPTRRFVRRLEGRGWVFGVKLRPGMSVALLDGPASALRDRVLPIASLLGAEGAAWARGVQRRRAHAERVEHSEAFLLARARPVPPEALLARDLVERAAVDRSLIRVDAWAQEAGLPLRRFERLLDRYVGVRPKWVLQRYRLHEANERLKAQPGLDLAALALELGYTDQPHFARDFKAVVGVAPGTYARLVRSDSPLPRGRTGSARDPR